MFSRICFRRAPHSQRFQFSSTAYTRNATSSSKQPPSADRQMTLSRGGKDTGNRNVITMETAKAWRDMSPKEKVVFATKQTSYTGVILAGLGISGALIYFTISELFSANQATSVYGKSLDMVKAHEKAKALLGEPIKGYQSHTRRSGSFKDLITFNHPETGEKMAFMRYGVSGSINQGTVHVLLKENPSDKKMEYLNVAVEIPGSGLPSKKVMVLNNNKNFAAGNKSAKDSLEPILDDDRNN